MNKTLIVFAFLGLFLVEAVQRPQTRGIACKLCKDFVTDLEKELENDEGTIEQKAEKVCDKITMNDPTLDKLCKQFIDAEIDKIVKGIENNDPPEKICKDISFC
uniref:Saposin B-type domain-containing protein n=1 Tax=Panagrolaimus superbus TaxID=310955 RepID=A0A914Z7X1_9BILA